MLAFGISVALFLFWLFLGMGILASLRFGRHAIRNVLLAPTVGASATLLPVFWLSRLGLPVKLFAGWVGVALLVIACLLAVRFRPRFPWKSYVPFVLLLALGAGLTIRPMFTYGFNWVSYANDDMANYVLAGERLYEHGYSDTPTVTEYLSDSDPSLHYWFSHVYYGARTGSELLLAWLHGVVGKTTLELFMPLIVALYFMLLSAVGGMIYRTAGHRKNALWTCLLVDCSALTSLGVLYQLIAQVWGLALLASCLAFLTRPYERTGRSRLIKIAVLAAITIAALVISYPEMLPFLIGPVAIFAMVRAVKRKAWRTLAIAYGLITAVTLVFINTYTRTAAAFFIVQLFKGAGGGGQSILFPYFLVPSGLANFWGMLPIELAGSEPWLSIEIAIGGILLLLAMVAVLRQAIRCEPWALVAAIMLLLTLRLFTARSDFGLFKLAMFVQPFLLATLATSWTRRIRVHALMMAVLATIGLVSQFNYVERSTGEMGRGGSGLAEVPGASSTGLVGKLIDEHRQLKPRYIVSDTSHTSLGKFECAAMFGVPIVFPADDVFGGVVGNVPKDVIKFFGDRGIPLLDPKHMSYGEFLRDSRKATYITEFFRDPKMPKSADMFHVPQKEQNLPPSQDVLLLANGHSQGVLNRSLEKQDSSVVVAKKLAAVQNYLIFIASALGRPPAYDGDTTGMGLFRLEPDPTYNTSSVAGLGHFLLFEVLNPTAAGHVVLNVTSTYMANGQSQVPAAKVMGSQTMVFDAVGRGSARLFSPEVTPQIVGGRLYLLLDMGSDGSLFPERRKGLMKLFGRNMRVDNRRMVGFARDISFLSDAAYTALTPPEAVAEFPKGLDNPALEYSGLYEDGWVAEDCYLRLRQPGSAALRVTGLLPNFRGGESTRRLRILEDGAPLFDEKVAAGQFDLKLAATGAPGQHVIRLQLEGAKQLSAEEDPRPAAARLSYVGFDSSVTKNPKDITDPAVAEIGAYNWYPLEHAGGLTFRWVNNDAELLVRSHSQQAALVFDLEPGPSQKNGKVQLSLVNGAGKTVASAGIEGRQLVQFNVPVSAAGLDRYRLHVSEPGKPVPGDGRTLNVRVFHVGPPGDAMAAGSGIEFGKGWYGRESFGGESFRWAQPRAELYVTTRGSLLTGEIEPLSDRHPVSLNVFDGGGKAVFHTILHGRSVVKIPVRATGAARAGLVFQVDGPMPTRPANDPRQLAFRVLRLKLE